MTLLREWKDKLQLGEIFETQVPHKESVSKIQKEPAEFNSTKPIKKWAKKKNMNRHFPRCCTDSK